jgi:hypothetical protein
VSDGLASAIAGIRAESDPWEAKRLALALLDRLAAPTPEMLAAGEPMMWQFTPDYDGPAEARRLAGEAFRAMMAVATNENGAG